MRGERQRFRRSVHNFEQRFGDAYPHAQQHHAADNRDNHGRKNNAVNIVGVLAPYILGNNDGRADSHARKQVDQKVDERAVAVYRALRDNALEPKNYRHVRGREKLL